MKFFGEISNNWPNDLLGTNACKTLEFFWQSLLTILQCTNTTSVTSQSGTFSPCLSLFILLLVLPSSFINSGVKTSR